MNVKEISTWKKANQSHESTSEVTMNRYDQHTVLWSSTNHQRLGKSEESDKVSMYLNCVATPYILMRVCNLVFLVLIISVLLSSSILNQFYISSM